MKVVIDDKIPFIQGVFEPFAEVLYVRGDLIDASVVKDANALVVRTRTQCDEKLLKGSSVEFIATATIGYDHIDVTYCEKQGIKWVSAPGCNADAVVQYVFSALGHLALKYGFVLQDKVLGIVGVGNVGSRVANFAEKLGMKVLQNDPPRALREGGHGFVDLDVLVSESDIMTFHTPLTASGDFPTYHLLDLEMLSKSTRSPIVINASRGEVCNNEALLLAKKNEQLAHLVIDCWENEPDINLDLLQVVDLATPHIAGYSMEGKLNATQAVVRQLSQFFNLGIDDWEGELPFAPPMCFNKSLLSQVVSSYPIARDDEMFRKNLASFEELRGNYQYRREPEAIH